jgi:hypothetical protein
MMQPISTHDIWKSLVKQLFWENSAQFSRLEKEKKMSIQQVGLIQTFQFPLPNIFQIQHIIACSFHKLSLDY